MFCALTPPALLTVRKPTPKSPTSSVPDPVQVEPAPSTVTCPVAPAKSPMELKLPVVVSEPPLSIVAVPDAPFVAGPIWLLPTFRFCAVTPPE